MFVSSEATILHADLDAFYASVEQRDDPGLRGRPVIVGGGVVLAASYEAKAFGVRTAMGGARPGGCARRRSWSRRGCRPTPRRARRCSRSSSDTTPLVEGLSIDEAFLDVARPAAGSRARRRRSPRGCGARCSSGSACRSPSGWPGRSSWPRWPAAWPSPTACSWSRPTASWRSCTRCRSSGCGASARSPPSKLHERGITHRRRGRPRSPRTALVSMLGRASGRHLHALAHNRDPRRVQVGRRRRSIGSQRALGRGAEIARGPRRRPRRARRPGDAAGCARARRVVPHRRRCGCASTTSSRATRSHTLPEATAADPDDPRHGAGAARRRPCR